MFVFYPLSDDNPTTKTPILTWTIIGINVLIFLYQLSIGDAANNRLIDEYAVYLVSSLILMMFIPSSHLHFCMQIFGIYSLICFSIYLWRQH